ncbi:MAG: hypothetical protein M0Q90_14200 [Bacteroidales bacterium]|nr:hypothetical protein [Bacteroidales bacterium]
MILGYKERFKQPILDKTKIHTIREDAHDRWKVGMTIQHATGVRTKNYNQFAEGQCQSTQRIEIERTSDFLIDTIVKIDGRKLAENEVRNLAFNDGFQNLVAFYMFFANGFKGKIIHWTELKY